MLIQGFYRKSLEDGTWLIICCTAILGPLDFVIDSETSNRLKGGDDTNVTLSSMII